VINYIGVILVYKEIKRIVDKMPWYLKVLSGLVAIEYLFRRKGLIGYGVQGIIVVLIAAVLFPLLFFGYVVVYVYYMVDAELLLCLKVVFAAVVIGAAEVVLLYVVYTRKKKKKVDLRNILFLFPLFFGILGGVVVSLFVKRDFGRKLISVGFLQIIFLLAGLMGYIVITDEPAEESFIVTDYWYGTDSLVIHVKNTGIFCITVETVYQNGRAIECHEVIKIHEEKDIEIHGKWYNGDIVKLETVNSTKVAFVVEK
jgi:hypothetical protein